MIDWRDIDAVFADFGYGPDRRYRALGDCPPDVITAVTGAADARHAAATDDNPPTAASLQLIRDNMNEHRPDLPDSITLRTTLTPSVTIYKRDA